MPAIKAKKAAVTKRNPPLSTRERIVAMSIRLFNREGVQNVAVERIAREAGMSPGTHTYHFARKQDLMREILAVLEKQMQITLSRPAAMQVPQHGGEYLKSILSTFWDFRFFFNSLTDLLPEDAQLRIRYFRFQEWAISTLDNELQILIQKKELQPMRLPNTSRLLAENMWSQWLNWLRMQQIAKPTAAVPAASAFYDGALHHWSLLEPYMSVDFAKGLLPVYKKLFGSKATFKTSSHSVARPKLAGTRS